MTDRRRERPRGYTLIEMVLVVGAVSLVLGLCATVLSAVFKVDRSGRNAVADATTIARLARQFRQDVRAAGTARVAGAKPPAGAGLDLVGTGGASIVYRVEGGRLVRQVRQGDTVGARESYAVERLGPVAFGVDAGRAWLVLARHPDEGPGLARPEVRIEARVGKDLELAGTTGGRK